MLIFGLFVASASGVSAAEASLYVSPGSGTYTVGSTFNVSVSVNSGGGVGINASDAVLTFDPSFLTVKKVSKSNSIFNLWTTEPSYSNQEGKVNYSGGSPSPYKGSAGTIMSITFTSLQAGETSLSFSGGSVLAADGKGTDVLGGTAGATYTFEEEKKEPEPKEPEPKEETPSREDDRGDDRSEEDDGNDEPSGILPPPPKISSLTHEEEDVWYSNDNPKMKWKLLSDISGISMALNDDPEAEPDEMLGVVTETKEFEEVSDGVKYFHIKFKNRHGWGPTSHRKLMIDTTPPDPFDIKVDNGGDPTEPRPDLEFLTDDDTSGIENYHFKLDGEITQMTKEEYEAAPYTMPILDPGQHEIAITVEDKAGNKASSSLEFIVEALKAPVITQIPRIIDKNEELVIQGTSFYPNSEVKVFITKDEEEVDTFGAKTDEDGGWAYFHKNTLPKGTFQVWAKVIDDRGAESNASQRKVLQVKAPSLVCAYGWWIISGLLLIILGLIGYIIYLRRGYLKQKERVIRESKELEQRLNDVFNALKEEVGELIEFADEKPGVSEAEKRVKNKIVEALDISQEFIGKEVKDVEKELE